MNKPVRIEPCESWGKFVLEVKIGDEWMNLSTDYRPVVERQARLIGELLDDSFAAERAFYLNAVVMQQREIQQTLGRALGYPRFCDDKANWPDATESDGVCVGDHVAESLASEAAKRIAKLESRVADLERALRSIADSRCLPGEAWMEAFLRLRNIAREEVENV